MCAGAGHDAELPVASLYSILSHVVLPDPPLWDGPSACVLFLGPFPTLAGLDVRLEHAHLPLGYSALRIQHERRNVAVAVAMQRAGVLLLKSRRNQCRAVRPCGRLQVAWHIRLALLLMLGRRLAVSLVPLALLRGQHISKPIAGVGPGAFSC